MAKRKAEKKPEPQKNPIAKVEKRYACARWPFLGLGGGLRFDNGHLLAKTDAEVERVERTDAFQHGQIVEIKEKKHGEEPTIQESAVLEALEQLKQLAPKSRRGAVSTATMAG